MMDWIFFSRALMDTGVLILIWLVQLVIYPSFLAYQEANFKAWHQQYTSRVSIVIMPLMLLQLGLHILLVIKYFRVIDIMALLLVILMWAITFFISVPLHSKCLTEKNTQGIRLRLVQTNWWRTIGWSFVFGLTVYQYLFCYG